MSNREWEYFVIGEKDGRFVVQAACTNEGDAQDAASDCEAEFDRTHIAESIEVAG